MCMCIHSVNAQNKELMQQNITVLSPQNSEQIVTFIIMGVGGFCLTNTHPKEKGRKVLWGSQSPLVWVSHAPGLAHSLSKPNQPPRGTKSQYSSTLIRWHANEAKSIRCFPAMTEAKSSCISAYEMVASFTINFHQSTRRGRDTEPGKQSWSLGRGDQVGILGPTGAPAGPSPWLPPWFCGSVATLHQMCTDGFEVRTCPSSKEGRILLQAACTNAGL